MNQLQTENLKSIFIIGNKRSGTTLILQMLNMHPNVGITNESDVMWMLYQIKEKLILPDPYEWDAPGGMMATMAALSEHLDLRKTFYKIQECVLSKQLKRKDLKNITWIGDKKPVQNADPMLKKFTESLLPGTKYIHIVRHPHSVLLSMKKAAETWPLNHMPLYWQEDDEIILHHWMKHENWVLNAKKNNHNIHTVKYENLCETPEIELNKCFSFLEIDNIHPIDFPIKTNVTSPDTRLFLREYGEIAGLRKLMTTYNYRNIKKNKRKII